MNLDELNFQMLTQIKERVRHQKLLEGYKTAKDFSVAKIVLPSSINKWAGKSNKEVFEAAKKKDKGALEYLFYKMEPVIQQAFWKNYLGPSGEMRRYRIQHESAWEQWLGIAWMVLTGGFDEFNSKEGTSALFGTTNKDGERTGGFDVSKNSEESIMGVFANKYKMLLKNAAVNSNLSKDTGGITGKELSGGSASVKVHQYEPTWYDSDVDDNEWDDESMSHTSRGYKDDTFEAAYENSFKEVDDNLYATEFLKKWKNYVQDPALRKDTKGVTAADIFHEIIENPKAEFRAMGAKFGISRNSAATLMDTAQKKLADYNISGQELMTAIQHLGNSKVASYLNAMSSSPAAETEREIEAIAEPPKETDFLTHLSSAFEDEEFWIPANKPNPANMLNWWIKENYKDVDELSEEYEMKRKDVVWLLNKAFKILKKYSLSKQDIIEAVKHYGKRKVTGCIGQSA